jgi:hypothetical protein
MVFSVWASIGSLHGEKMSESAKKEQKEAVPRSETAP